MESNKKTEYRAPALEKGLEILELLAEQSEPLSKKQIAEKLNRSINEIFRMLSVLMERQYIEYDSETSCYSLTLKMFALSNQHPPLAQMLKRANPLMEALCHKVNQSCHLCSYKNGELLVIAREESPYKMGFSLRLGSKIDVCSSGSGIVLLSFSEEKQRKEILKKARATADEVAHALSHIDKTVEQGFYIGESPQISGVTNISVPIFGVLGEVMAVITVPYMTLNSITVHHHIEDIEHTKTQLLNVAGQLSQNL
ncbi:IclR family transcriptional regulator [Vibrio sp. ABG19]|uniref:IclR family transcriptional regulator n=1 Tax=Vibrio sp. ABG19 TaxID=2817385 RepID=UPI00249E52F7|nr:IclR family transcriptional regulator [Vibrio sp. ABG19]WGY46871.1 IclR family transcriptional regulator [Vibrio sp. ABG19]